MNEEILITLLEAERAKVRALQARVNHLHNVQVWVEIKAHLDAGDFVKAARKFRFHENWTQKSLPGLAETLEIMNILR